MCMVVIRLVSNANDIMLSWKQLHLLYTTVGQREELIDLINKKGGPKKQCILTSLFTCTFERDQLDEEYI